MTIPLLFTPFIAWLVAGCLKFALNTLREKRFAFDLIGYGGMPSNHAAIVCSAFAAIYLREGPNSPSTLVSATFVFIVLLDAKSLRGEVGKHSIAINKLMQNSNGVKFRERIGHSKIELLAGAVVGFATAFALFQFSLLT